MHGPRRHQLNEAVQAVPREEGAIGGEKEEEAVGEKKEEGAVGGEESEEEEALQVLYESLSIEEPAPAPITPAPRPTETPRQSHSRGRGVLMYTRERSVSRIGWVRSSGAEQQEDN